MFTEYLLCARNIKGHSSELRQSFHPLGAYYVASLELELACHSSRG